MTAIRVMPTRTDKVPNTSATAASASTDLNGAAVADAARGSLDRLTPVAAGLLACNDRRCRVQATARVSRSKSPHRRSLEASVEAAYHGASRSSLRASTVHPEFNSNPKRGGKTVSLLAFGAAVSEVEIDGFTGDNRLFASISSGRGRHFSPLIDRGQIEGGFIQGLGWLTIEELLWDKHWRSCHQWSIHIQAAVVVRNPR